MKKRYFTTLLCGVFMMSNPVGADDKRLDQDGPPLQYRLDEVAISVTHQAGRNAAGSISTVITHTGASPDNVQGAAGDDSAIGITLAEKDLVSLLNEFYSARFFDLPDSSSTHYSVVLQDDGSVKTLGTRLADTGSTRLCLNIAAYEKCVTVIRGEPQRADRLVNFVEGMVEKLK